MPIDGYAKESHRLKTARPIAAGFGLGRAFDWLQEQWRRSVAIRRVNAIPDYLLKDAGVERRSTDWVTDERVKRLRWGAIW